MPFTRAGQLARHTPVALLGTPLGLVAENLRESHYGTIPVLDALPPDPEDTRFLRPRPRVLGLLDERDLARATLPILQGAEARRPATVGVPEAYAWSNPPLPDPSAPRGGALNGHASSGHPLGGADGLASSPVAAPELLGTEAVRDLTARDIMRPDWDYVPSDSTLHNTLLTLDRCNALALPVLNAEMGYQGMISRADVVAALGAQVRPPVVGGMATPLGVWLTTGTLSAGAPPLGLFLSGAIMGGIMIGVRALLTFVFSVMNPGWGMIYYSGRLGLSSESASVFNLIVTVIELFAFLIVMRLLPLAGTHAAEHQTVHAIERGLPLEPDIVKTMPRAHPRCGTNLVALAMMIEIIFQHLPSIDGGTVLIALLFVFFAWRSFGTALQVVFTTRPASPKQLASGIKAGRDLLEKYQAQPHVLAPMPMRLLNSGILLAGLGAALTTQGGEWLLGYAAQWLLHSG